MSLLKKVVFVTVALSFILFLGACKKEQTPALCRPTHFHFLTSNNEMDIVLQRNGNGKIIQRTTTAKDRVTGNILNTTVDNYSYGSPTEITQTTTSSNSGSTVTNSLTNVVTLNSDGYVVSMSTSFSNSTSIFTSTYTYDSNGYLQTEQNSSSSGIITYSYLNGNLVSSSSSAGWTRTYEYYLNMPNKLLSTDVEPFSRGKPSANLPKKETYTDTGYLSVSDYTYTSLNTSDYPLGMSINQTSTRGTGNPQVENLVYDIRYVCE